MSSCLCEEKTSCNCGDECKCKSRKKLTAALAGNPNSGKTTLFNALTGAKQHVGNYPGVTVEKKEGMCKFKNREINIVDLPGTYSLTDYSPEELVARDFIMDEHTDVIVDVIDGSNLERNLYLALQLLEMEKPLIFAFNMMDEADAMGYGIDMAGISKTLNVPIIRTIASKGEGIDLLMSEVVNMKGKKVNINYSENIEREIKKLSNAISDYDIFNKYSPRWMALKLLENDKNIINISECFQEIIHMAEESRRYLKGAYNKEAEYIISEERYKFIEKLIKDNVTVSGDKKISLSEKIDNIVTHRFLGFPIFIFSMWLVFHLTFTIGNYPVEWIENITEIIGNGLSTIIKGGIFNSLVVDGIVGGVGNVFVFLPNIIILFFAIALLEDTGYMARIAFIMDKIMNKIGLHGRSFIPLLVGFGCNVPAVMATRTLDSRKNRLITILVMPFMSCSAKLPVYSLFISAFFPVHIAGTVMFSLYLTGIILSVIMAKIFSKYLFPEEKSFFIMELPPYRIPTFKTLLIHTWQRGKFYIQKAGTVILAFSVIIWLLTSFPSAPGGEKSLEISYAGKIGKLMEPLIKPLGFDYKTGIALIAGFAAKEVVVSTMGTIYNLEEVDENSISLKEAIRKDNSFSPLKALSLLLFVLLYMPCMSAISVIYREVGLKFTCFVVFYTTAIAWLVSFFIYQGGMLLGLG